MNRPEFKQPSNLWFVDGSLRDVYVQETGLDDWNSLLVVVRNYTHQYFRDGVEMAMPEPAAIFEDREHSHLLGIEAASVRIHCHFFIPDEIELNIDPKEVSGPREHLATLQFLEEVAAATRKDVLLTWENSPELVLLRYRSNAESWHTH